jgi:hypothetical protein
MTGPNRQNDRAKTSGWVGTPADFNSGTHHRKITTAGEREWNYSNDFKTFALKMAQAKARIWPGLACLFQVRSTALE